MNGKMFGLFLAAVALIAICIVLVLRKAWKIVMNYEKVLRRYWYKLIQRPAYEVV